ncbi:MAG: hypothetical protein MK085_10465 [Phycisphaerales bacterium]|nr:hypothetical protein [Phycisphaerales bacterium]
MRVEQPLRVVFLGSGAFGLPTLEAILEKHDVPLVVSQPDRPAGRGRRTTPTPISSAVLEREDGPELLRVESVNDPEARQAIDAARPDALVVIAFGQKIGPELLAGHFAINLHGSLLPRWRGAAPINRAMMAGDRDAGVSVIALAERMDAGGVYATATTPIEPQETAGELHDRLSVLGVETVLSVLEDHAAGRAEALPQDETRACHAAKLGRRDGTVRFDAPADLVRSRINGLSPWPGCDVLCGGARLRLRRAVVSGDEVEGVPGTLHPDGHVRCGSGAIRLLDVQPHGKPTMAWEAFARGRGIEAGTVLEPMPDLEV